MKQNSFMLLLLVLTFIPYVSCHDIKESYDASFNEIAPFLKTPVLKIGIEPIRLPDKLAKISRGDQVLKVVPSFIYERGDTHRIYPGILVLPPRFKFNDDCELIIPPSINYKVILSDSSRVVVDSESSIKFQLQFNKSRIVKLRGKALFDIHPDSRPFIVQVGSLEVFPEGEANFNVTAYNEVNPRIAVISGSVKIVYGNTSILLKEGHQGLFVNRQCLIEPCDSLCDSLSVTYKRVSDMGE